MAIIRVHVIGFKCCPYIWVQYLTPLVQYRSLPLKHLSHVAHWVFISFCDSSSSRFHLRPQKNVIPSSDVRGRHDCFRFRKHPSSFTMLKQETSSTTLSCIDGLEVSHQTVMIEVRGLGFDFRLWQGLYSC